MVTKVGIPLSRIPSKAVSAAELAQLRALDTNHNDQLDLSELSDGLHLEPMRFRVGKLFQAGVATLVGQKSDAVYQDSVYRTFLKMDTDDRLVTLLSVDGWTQSALMAALISSTPKSLDAGYLWARLAKKDNGVLGGILMRTLREYGKEFSGAMLNDAHITALADQSLEARLKTYLESVSAIYKTWTALPAPGVTMRACYPSLGYFPTAQDATRYLVAQPGVVFNPRASLSAELQKIESNFSFGVGVAIVSGQGFIIYPRGKAPAEPRLSPEEVAARRADLKDRATLLCTDGVGVETAIKNTQSARGMVGADADDEEMIKSGLTSFELAIILYHDMLRLTRDDPAAYEGLSDAYHGMGSLMLQAQMLRTGMALSNSNDPTDRASTAYSEASRYHGLAMHYWATKDDAYFSQNPIEKKLYESFLEQDRRFREQLQMEAWSFGLLRP